MERRQRHHAAHHRALAGHTGVVAKLIERGADPSQVKSDGEPPLLVAATTDNAAAIVGTLLEAGARHDIKDRFGGTALLMHAQLGRREAAR